MSTPRTHLRFALAFALLLFGMSLGATDAPGWPPEGAPVAAHGQAGDGAGPIWFSSGPEAPAAPETASSRGAPELSTVATPGGVALAGVQVLEHVAAGEAAGLRGSTPLYLSHCAFLC